MRRSPVTGRISRWMRTRHLMSRWSRSPGAGADSGRVVVAAAPYGGYGSASTAAAHADGGVAQPQLLCDPRPGPTLYLGHPIHDPYAMFRVANPWGS